jgi:hypothetical protein
MTWATMENESAKLVRKIVPDLANVPLYVVSANKLSEEAKVGGLTAMNLDLAVRPYVQWQGRGVAIVYKMLAATILSAKYDITEQDALQSIVLHEVAHAIEGAFFEHRQEEDKALADEAAEAARCILAQGIDILPPDWHVANYLVSHGVRFLRVLAHLRYRAQAVGVECCLDQLYQYEVRGLAVDLYASAFRNECRELRRCRFATILAEPLPQSARDLWRRDSELICESFSAERDRAA